MDLAQLLYKLFRGNRSTYAVQKKKPNGDIFYYRVQKEVTVETYNEHLIGDSIIGIYPLLANKTHCYFACVDIDYPDFKLAKQVADLLPQPNYIERSRSNNYHIWMFFTHAQKVSVVERESRKAILYARECGHEHCGLYPAKPRESTLPQFGLLIALPLMRYCVEDDCTVFVDNDGATVDPYDLFIKLKYTKLRVLAVSTPNDEIEILKQQRFKLLWLNKGKVKGDTSASGYDFSFCFELSKLGWARQEIRDLLLLKPTLHSNEEKYITTTVDAAIEASIKFLKFAKKKKLSVDADLSSDKLQAIESWENVEPIDREQFFERIRPEIVLDDAQVEHFDMFFAVLMANLKTVGRPVWMLFIGPPGSGKTLPMMALRNSPFTYSCSTFRPASLISGWGMKGGADMSLMPKLADKILMVKDMSSLLSQHREVVAEIMGLLRDAYDGSCTRVFGTGVERTYQLRFGFMGAATPDIDVHHSINSRLGARFIKYRVRSTMDQVYKKIDKAVNSFMTEDGADDLLEQACLGFLKYLTREDTVLAKLHNPRQLGRLAQLGAILRTAVARGFGSREVLIIPQWEEATRYTKQLAKMQVALAYVRGREDTIDEDFDSIKQLVRDSLDARVEKVCRIIYSSDEEIELESLALKVGLPLYSVRAVLDDLEISRILIKTRKGFSMAWQFVPWILGQIDEFKLWQKQEN